MRYAAAVKAPGFGDRRKAMLEAGNANNADFEGAVVVQHVMEGEGKPSAPAMTPEDMY